MRTSLKKSVFFWSLKFLKFAAFDFHGASLQRSDKCKVYFESSTIYLKIKKRKYTWRKTQQMKCFVYFVTLNIYKAILNRKCLMAPPWGVSISSYGQLSPDYSGTVSSSQTLASSKTWSSSSSPWTSKLVLTPMAKFELTTPLTFYFSLSTRPTDPTN